MRRRFAPRGASIEQRLDAQSIPEPNSGCHLWIGALYPTGYGMIGVNGRPQYAHRLAYEAYVGPIPEGLHIDHLCRNVACINPRHLEAVTPRENILRGVSPIARQARQTHCLRGHEFSNENTYQMKDGGRACKECRRIKGRRHYKEIRERGERQSVGAVLPVAQTDWLRQQAAIRGSNVAQVIRELVQAAMSAATAKQRRGAA